MGMAEYLKSCHISVPDDMLVSGFNGNSVTQTLERHLLTIQHPILTMADVMARWLSDPAHPKSSPEHVTLPDRVLDPQNSLD